MNQQGIEDESSVTVFDWLLVLAENVRFLVIGTVVIGLGAFGLAQLVSPKYVSQAILLLSTTQGASVSSDLPDPIAPQVASIMLSPVVLDPVIASLDLAKGRPLDLARRALAEQVSAIVTKEGLLHVQVTDAVPETAQAIGNAVIDTWLKTTVPSEQQRVELEARLAFARAALNTNVAPSPAGSTAPGQPASTGFGPGELRSRYFDEVIRIPKILRGVTREVVRLAPTLPTEKAAPDIGRITILSATFGFLALLLFLLIRQSWRGAMQNPRNARKWGEVRAAFGLRGTSES